MFVSGEIGLEMPFADALARLTGLARGGWLRSASAEAYGESGAALARVGPLGAAPGLSRLVQVRFRELAVHEDHAVLPLRWEATGTSGGLFPALDADITLSRAGERSSVLMLSGVYRPPLGALGAGLDRAGFNRVAIATIRKFMSRAGDAMTTPASTSELAPAQTAPAETTPAETTPAETAPPQTVPAWSWLTAPQAP
jgi:hypothetical protein